MLPINLSRDEYEMQLFGLSQKTVVSSVKETFKETLDLVLESISRKLVTKYSHEVISDFKIALLNAYNNSIGKHTADLETDRRREITNLQKLLRRDSIFLDTSESMLFAPKGPSSVRTVFKTKPASALVNLELNLFSSGSRSKAIISKIVEEFFSIDPTLLLPEDEIHADNHEGDYEANLDIEYARARKQLIALNVMVDKLKLLVEKITGDEAVVDELLVLKNLAAHHDVDYSDMIGTLDRTGLVPLLVSKLSLDEPEE